MNLIDIVTVDFIEQLRQQVRGWTMIPLIPYYPDQIVGHGGLLCYRPCPAGVSPVAYLQTNVVPRDHCFVQIKASKKPLRLIRLDLKPPLVTKGLHSHTISLGQGGVSNPTRPLAYLSYWRANGWVRHDDGTYNRFRSHYHAIDSPPEDALAFLIYQIHRIYKPSRKRRTIIYQDCIDFSDPVMSLPLLQIVAKTIEKSWEQHGYRRHKKADGSTYEDFSPSAPCLMVDIDQGNYECKSYLV
jgi:hypothetical protein